MKISSKAISFTEMTDLPNLVVSNNENFFSSTKSFQTYLVFTKSISMINIDNKAGSMS